MEYTVYILFSLSLNKYYIGYTSGPIDERVRKHLTAHSGFTSNVKDWTLKYLGKFNEKRSAWELENRLDHGRNAKSQIIIPPTLGGGRVKGWTPYYPLIMRELCEIRTTLILFAHTMICIEYTISVLGF